MAKDREPRKPLTAFERAVQNALGEERSFGSEADPARMTFPALWQWLTSAYVGPEHLKTPPTISITLGPEGVLVRLVDRDLAATVQANCPFLADSFLALESALTSSNPPVVSWGRKEPNLRKRKSRS